MTITPASATSFETGLPGYVYDTIVVTGDVSKKNGITTVSCYIRGVNNRGVTDLELFGEEVHDVYTATQGELLSMLKGVKAAGEYSAANICIVSDSMHAVHAVDDLNGKDARHVHYYNFARMIRGLIETEYEQWKVSLIPREGNEVADGMAKRLRRHKEKVSGDF